MKKINLIVACLAILAYSFSLAGCDAKKKALQEADRAQKETTKVKKALAKAQAEITDLKEELYAAKNMRDELDQQVRLLMVERDKALGQTLQYQEAMQDAANTDDPVVTALRTEIAQLKNLIAEQQKAIAEQEAVITELAETVQPAEEMVEVVEEPEMVEPAIDPNEPTEPDDTL